ncbi:MAG: hypothetical protein R3A52_05835 [Polyangiales bacterium]
MARTGFHSRFTFGERGMSPVGRVTLTTFVLAFGLLLTGAGLLFGARAVQSALDPTDALYRVARPAPADGPVVRGPVTVTADTAPRALCHVQHQHYVSGKNGGWRTDWRGNVFRGASVEHRGRTYSLEVDGYLTAFEPSRTRVAPDGLRLWTPRFRSLPGGGRVVEQCLSPGERVFIEACRQPGRPWVLSDCPDYPMRLTQGDNGSGQPRVDARANALAAQVSGGALGVLALLLWAWFLVRSRPLSEALRRRAGVRKAKFPAAVVAGAVSAPICFAVAQGIVVGGVDRESAWDYFQGGYTFGVAVVSFALALAYLVYARRRALDEAIRPVVDAPTVRVCDARGGVVELAVTVPPDAPTVVGPVSGRPHAWVRVVVDEVVQHGKQMLTQRAAAWSSAPSVPVRDASGVGALEMNHAELDLRARVVTVKHGSKPELLAAVARVTGARLHPASTHLRWIIEEGFVDPGESLYALGDCRRVEDPKAAASYRADATLPVVGGQRGAELVVHAGDERSLLSSLRRERVLLDLVGAAFVGLAASLAAVLAALASR